MTKTTVLGTTNEYDNITDLDTTNHYNNITNKITNNFPNNENNGDINIPTLLISLPCGL